MVEIFAHRGDSKALPENTMAAFRSACRVGADGIEFDVRLTGDGQVVVFHDRELSRMCNRPERIEDLAHAELSKILVAREKIPLLSEVLEEFRGASAFRLNIEIKSDLPGSALSLARRASEEVARVGNPQQVLYSSFDWSALAAIRARWPAANLGLLYSHPHVLGVAIPKVAKMLGAIAVHPSADALSRDDVMRWIDLGIEINTWTVDDLERARELFLLGASAVMTNVPASLLALRKQVFPSS